MLSLNLSQKQLADVVQVSQQSINKYENHSVQPDLDTLMRLASYFDVSVDYLLGEEETAETKKSPSMELTEGERMLLELFRKVPESQQQMVLQMISVALKSIE